MPDGQQLHMDDFHQCLRIASMCLRQAQRLVMAMGPDRITEEIFVAQCASHGLDPQVAIALRDQILRTRGPSSMHSGWAASAVAGNISLFSAFSRCQVYLFRLQCVS